MTFGPNLVVSDEPESNQRPKGYDRLLNKLGIEPNPLEYASQCAPATPLFNHLLQPFALPTELSSEFLL